MYNKTGSLSNHRSLFIIAISIFVSFGLFFTVISVVYAHHGWAEFDQTKEVTLEGIVKEPAFEYPHTSLKLETGNGTWQIQMAPPRRVNRIGINEETLQDGMTITVTGHPHRQIEKMMRIFTIVIDDEELNVR